MLTQVGRQYDNWDQYVTAVEDRYDQQDRGAVENDERWKFF